MARELAPAGLRSGPFLTSRHTALSGFTTASQPSGSKLPRHRISNNEESAAIFISRLRNLPFSR
ncbi:hypothetical protein EAH78_24885 [Pseudomonas arsenicoxydans]|uniref:Uncharacterized protein n=1 Tax=Pseudomonas arsenicoxydans TaxID=702115 RepID=A0A502HM18_9PSED|nr:hypothetical protein EAH78_24885 [Pseudomonas arsenicoxydans]